MNLRFLEVVRKLIFIRTSTGYSTRTLPHEVAERVRGLTAELNIAVLQVGIGATPLKNDQYALLCALLYSRLTEYMKGSNISCCCKTLVAEFTSLRSWKLEAGIVQKLN
jgi:hypothetical protein